MHEKLMNTISVFPQISEWETVQVTWPERNFHDIWTRQKSQVLNITPLQTEENWEAWLLENINEGALKIVCENHINILHIFKCSVT